MSLRTDQEQAEREMLEAQHAIADQYNAQYEERKDLEKPFLEAANEMKKQNQMDNDLAKATAGNDTEAQSGYVSTAQKIKANNDKMLANYQETVKTKIAQRDAKMQSVMALKEMASEEAKKKYDLAVQRRSQAQANISSVTKLLGSLGCALPFPWNLFATGVTAIAGTVASEVI